MSSSLVRKVLMVLVALAIVAALVYAFRPKPISVDVAVIKKGPMKVVLSEMARARIKDRYVVSTPIAGNVLRLELHPGDRVAAGAVLARIVPSAPPLLDARTKAEAEARAAAAEASHKQTKAAIERANLLLDRARHELGEIRTLQQQGAANEDTRERAELEEKLRVQDLASAKFAESMAAHESAMAKVALQKIKDKNISDDHLEVRAPVEGVVLRVLAPSGGVLGPGTPLLELGDPSALEIVCEVLTADAAKIHAGSKASLERWGGDALNAHVRLVEPSAFTRISSLGVDEQRVNVVMDLDEPREKWVLLGDGYRLEAKISLWERDNVLVAPEGSLFRKAGQWSVYSFNNGVATVESVKVGQRNGLEVQIEEGLIEGQKVLVYPGDRVTAGSKVVAR